MRVLRGRRGREEKPRVLGGGDESQGVREDGEVAGFDQPEDHVLLSTRVLVDSRRVVVQTEVRKGGRGSCRAGLARHVLLVYERCEGIGSPCAVVALIVPVVLHQL